MTMITRLIACCAFLTLHPDLSERDVRTFIARYDRAWIHNDTVTVQRTLAEHYVYFASSGKTLDRNHILTWFRPPHVYVTDSTSTRTEIQVALTGTVAVVSSRWRGTGSFDGKRFDDDQRCSVIVAEVHGELQILTEHCTQIAPP
jgi:hypothetical protein